MQSRTRTLFSVCVAAVLGAGGALPASAQTAGPTALGRGGNGGGQVDGCIANGGAPGVPGQAGRACGLLGTGGAGGGAGASGGAGGPTPVSPTLTPGTAGAAGVMGVNLGRGGNGGNATMAVGAGGGGGGADCFRGPLLSFPVNLSCKSGDGGNGGASERGYAGGGGGGGTITLLGTGQASIAGQLTGGDGGRGGLIQSTGIVVASPGFAFAASGGSPGAGLVVADAATITVTQSGRIRGGRAGLSSAAQSLAGTNGSDGVVGCSPGGHGEPGVQPGLATVPPPPATGPGVWLLDAAQLDNSGLISGGEGAASSVAAPPGAAGGQGGRGGNGFEGGGGINGGPGGNGCRGGDGGRGADGPAGLVSPTGGAGLVAGVDARILNHFEISGGAGGGGSAANGGTGGRGGNGGRGGDGGFGGLGGFNVRGDGGNGGRGGDGGKGGDGAAGGVGGDGLVLRGGGELINAAGARVDGGVGGDGGQGGQAGAGGAGGDGGQTSGSATPGATGAAGRSGSGGRGGSGGTGGRAVVAMAADQIVNQGLLFGGLGGAGGLGRNFAQLNEDGQEGRGGDGGSGGDGVVLAEGASLDNRGEIYGGFGFEGANGGTNTLVTSICLGNQCDGGRGGRGGSGGVGVQVEGGSLTNSGRIEGGWGAWGGLAGGTGARVSIEGGESGDGGHGLVAEAGAVLTHTGSLMGGPGAPGRSGTNGGRRFGGDGGAGARISGGSLLGTEGSAETPASILGGNGGNGGTGSPQQQFPVNDFNRRGGRAGDGGVGLALADAAEWSHVSHANIQGGNGGIGGDNGAAGQELAARGQENPAVGGAGGAGGAGIELIELASAELLGRINVQGGRGGAGGACALVPTQPQNVAAHGGDGGAGIVLRNAELRWAAVSSSGSSVRGGDGGGIRLYRPDGPHCGVVGVGGPGVLLDGDAVLRAARFAASFVGGVSGAAVPEAAPGILMRGGGNELVLEGNSPPAARVVSESGDLNGGDTLVFDPQRDDETLDARRFQPGGSGGYAFEGFRRIEKRGERASVLVGVSDAVSVPLTVRAGELRVLNSLQGYPNLPVRVAGGRLYGSGTLGSLENEASVELRSNSSGGFLTLRVATFSQTSGTLQVAASGGASPANGRLEVSGAAQLAGTLRVDFAAPPLDGQIYTLLTAASLAGRFDSVVLNGAEGLGARLEYGERQANAVTLVIDASLAMPELFKNGFE